MQTFLPYRSFTESAKVLDRARLGKQRIEARQLVSACLVGSGWSNHPACLMWKGYEKTLCIYGMAICNEWLIRGYTDNQFDWFESVYYHLASRETHRPGQPPWLGDDAFHASHRSNLLRKDPIHYGRFDWVEPPDLPYVWPQAHLSVVR